MQVIYYGDLNVNIGQPFEITCIIPITAKVHWLKNGESITRHNLRHGRDDHSYAISETAFEGEYMRCEVGAKLITLQSTTSHTFESRRREAQN